MTLKGKGMPQEYGDETYWDSRYNQDVGSFDWYQRYAGMAPLINMYLPKEEKLLMVGCGNADAGFPLKVLKGRCYLRFVGPVISEDMVNDGYQTIMNIDISQIVIDAMIEKYKQMPQLQYQRMDVRSLSFKEGKFDSVVDKGMLDSLMCGADAPKSVASMIKEGFEARRCLHASRPGSRRAQECSSRPTIEPIPFQEDGITLESAFNLEDPDLHYVYVCIKERVSAAPPLEKKPPEKKMSKRISHKK